MSDVLIKVENVSKKFCRSLKRSLWYGLQDLGSEILGKRHGGDGALRPEEFWAVKDVSFELKRGECLGLIGRNGAGKTTLLKMLNGLIKPDQGRIEMRGRVGALIALGAGFNPILSGRENIYVNASVLGLSKQEVNAKIDEIIEFAEIGEFIDAPVKNYSSGMSVRLGFAVASSLNPDILLLDEVMSVGDMAFVLKCINRMDRLIQNTAVIFVSHSMPQVSRIATNILLMEGGKTIFNDKDVAGGIDVYYSNIKTIPSFSVGRDVYLGKVIINSMPYEGEPINVNRLEDVSFIFSFDVSTKHKELSFYLAFYDIEQRNVAEFVEDDNTVLYNINGKVRVVLRLPRINFSKGVYSITVALNSLCEKQVLLRVQRAAFFQVIAKKKMWSSFQLHGHLEQIIDEG